MDYYSKINLKVSVAGSAYLNIPHGVAPTAPVDGDVWTTTAGLYVRINGATVGPLSASGGGGGGTPTTTFTVPATPTNAGEFVLYSRRTGRVLPGGKGPEGDPLTLQPHIGRNRATRWQSNGNALGVSADGLPAYTVIGTAATQGVWGTTNALTRMRRHRFATTATAGNLSGAYWPSFQLWTLGDGSLGGFHLISTFGIPSGTIAGAARFFLGLSGSNTAATNVEPTTIANQVGVGKISTSNNLHIIVTNGTATPTVVDLGANFLANQGTAAAYMINLYAAPGWTNRVDYFIENLINGFTAEGSITTNLPASTTGMAPRWWVTNNTNASIYAVEVATLYIESDI